jgi:murein L,D-transpeptidase YafK
MNPGPRRALALVGATLAVAGGALAWPARAGDAAACKDPSIRVWKREGVVELACEGQVRRTMPASFGRNPVGPKEREGDERTPEGTYRVSSKVKNERFHRFLGVSYPNAEDRRRGAALGVTRLGDGIGIHGTRARLAPLARAWTRAVGMLGLASVWGPTDGCVGVANEDVEALFDAVAVGTPILIAAERPKATGER